VGDCNWELTGPESGDRALVGVVVSLSTRDVVGDIDSKALLGNDFSTATVFCISGDSFLFWEVPRLRRDDLFCCDGVVVPLTLFFCADLMGVLVSSSDDSVPIDARVVRCRFDVDIGVAGKEVLLRVARCEGESVDEFVLLRFIFWRKYKELGRFERGSLNVVWITRSTIAALHSKAVRQRTMARHENRRSARPRSTRAT